MNRKGRALFSAALMIVSTMTATTMTVMAQEGPPQPTAEQLAAMRATMQPGEGHERLASLDGSWHLAGRFRMGPDGPWNSFEARVNSESVLGGRFLLQRVTGQRTEWMPEPYSGLRMLGHDNRAGKYLLLYMENYDTAWWHATGSLDESDGAITFTPSEESSHPLRQRSRIVLRPTEEGYVIEEWDVGGDGGEYLAIELVHTQR